MTEENQIAKMTTERQVVVSDPFTADIYHGDAQGVIASITARKKARAEQFAALGDIAAAPLDAVKKLAKAVGDDDKTLVDYESKLKDALLYISGFKAVVVQMKGAKARIDPLSVRGKFAEIAKALKARIDAEKPPLPVHTYVVRLTVTDEGLNAVLKAAEKAGAQGVCYAAAQSDKAVKQIAAWFEQNA
jgi:hypothetical protein